MPTLRRLSITRDISFWFCQHLRLFHWSFLTIEFKFPKKNCTCRYQTWLCIWLINLQIHQCQKRTLRIIEWNFDSISNCDIFWFKFWKRIFTKWIFSRPSKFEKVKLKSWKIKLSLKIRRRIIWNRLTLAIPSESFIYWFFRIIFSSWFLFYLKICNQHWNDMSYDLDTYAMLRRQHRPCDPHVTLRVRSSWKVMKGSPVIWFNIIYVIFLIILNFFCVVRTLICIRS